MGSCTAADGWNCCHTISVVCRARVWGLLKQLSNCMSARALRARTACTRPKAVSSDSFVFPCRSHTHARATHTTVMRHGNLVCILLLAVNITQP
jgi:hypothetical protein